MTPNLRASFKERQCKRLSESFPTAPSPAKRTCLEVPPEISDAPLALMSPSNVVGFDQALIVSSSVEKNACPVQEMTSIGQTPGDDLTNKNALISFPAFRWDKIAALLKQVPCFTTSEPPSTNMDDFFPLTCRFFVDMLGNPPITIIPCLLMTLQNIFSSVFNRCSSTLLLRR